jgi:hypothetical protein
LGGQSRCSQWISPSQEEIWPRNELDIVVSKSAKSASYGHGSLVCGLWLAGGGHGSSVPTSVLGTFYIRFFMYQGYERRKKCNPAVCIARHCFFLLNII